ncbi:NupC/NupG family nucleoside CNT transporter [Anatilimnocola sp. NA78]|uniref:NupC/NupG family nucleoside CNT transporter n=1 Tax=Anatilimnocola sp. NA78 TaxID=3415683 RepID=UPI003CE46144
MQQRLISLLGLFVMIFLAWLMSSHKRRFPWRIVIAGITLQFFLGWLTLMTEPGRWFFDVIGNFFTKILEFTDTGSEFVFGKPFREHYFAFKVLPTIIFFSCFMSILYYAGAMQVLVKGLAWFMQKTLGTSGAETLSASANIFLGQTEAPLVIKPYLPTMTLSELNAVMVGGFSTISGGVLAAFVGMGIDAGHLVTASVISAPASLLLAKIMQPETEVPQTFGDVRIEPPRVGANVIEAAAIGASDGLKLALNVAAMLVAFMALIAMGDYVVQAIGDMIAHYTVFVSARDWSLQNAIGALFAPIALLMGIEWQDSGRAGELLGLKMFANEFVAYDVLHTWMKVDSEIKLQPRTIVIMTYALCGFSNFASIGIQIGGLGAMAPERQGDLARLGLRAMLGGTLACCMTACVAGVLIK